MKSLQLLLSSVSPAITVCVRGKHAIGKSEGVQQSASLVHAEFYRSPERCAQMVEALKNEPHVARRLAETKGGKWTYEMGLPIVERRLSQMTEGDIIGLPEMETVGINGTRRATTFRPCDWLINSVDFPVLLFLDERNRALEGVKQAVFQLADSKAFYGNLLHADTRIVIAENIGDAYTVNQSDPAEISRAATVELTATVEEWLEWARKHCHSATVEFILSNNKALEHTGTFEANRKYPDRRSWFKLDAELRRLGLFDRPEEHLFYVLSGAFLGTEVASLFHRFAKERDREVSAEDIVKGWDKVKARFNGEIANETYIELCSKLEEYNSKHELGAVAAYNIASFMKDAPPEIRMTMWPWIIKGNNSNQRALIKLCVPIITATNTPNLRVDDLVIPVPAEMDKSVASASPAKEKATPKQK
jgi:hypothetical protein